MLTRSIWLYAAGFIQTNEDHMIVGFHFTIDLSGLWQAISEIIEALYRTRKTDTHSINYSSLSGSIYCKSAAPLHRVKSCPASSDLFRPKVCKIISYHGLSF